MPFPIHDLTSFNRAARAKESYASKRHLYHLGGTKQVCCDGSDDRCGYRRLHELKCPIFEPLSSS